TRSRRLGLTSCKSLCVKPRSLCNDTRRLPCHYPVMPITRLRVIRFHLVNDLPLEFVHRPPFPKQTPARSTRGSSLRSGGSCLQPVPNVRSEVPASESSCLPQAARQPPQDQTRGLTD